jgi:hypothetical protein
MRLGIEQERSRKADRDAIKLPLFQLTEERAHLDPRRLSSVAHLKRHVDPDVIGVGKSKLGEVAVRVIGD